MPEFPQTRNCALHGNYDVTQPHQFCPKCALNASTGLYRPLTDAEKKQYVIDALLAKMQAERSAAGHSAKSFAQRGIVERAVTWRYGRVLEWVTEKLGK